MFENIKKGDKVIYVRSLFGNNVYSVYDVYDVTKTLIKIKIKSNNICVFNRVSGYIKSVNAFNRDCIIEYAEKYDYLISRSNDYLKFHSMKSFVIDELNRFRICSPSQDLNDDDNKFYKILQDICKVIRTKMISDKGGDDREQPK